MSDAAFFPVRMRRVRVALWVTIPLGIAMSIVLVVFGTRPPIDERVWIAGSGALIVVVLLWAWTWWWRLQRRIDRGEAPGLTIDTVGFEDTVTAGSVGRVSWSEVTTWWVSKANYRTMLFVGLDREPVVVSASPLVEQPNLLVRMEERIFRPSAGKTGIELNHLKATTEEIVDVFARFSGGSMPSTGGPSESMDDNSVSRITQKTRPPGRRHQWCWIASLTGAFALAVVATFTSDILTPDGYLVPEIAPFTLGVPALLMMNAVREVFMGNDAPVVRVDISAAAGSGPHRPVRELTPSTAHAMVTSLRAQGIDASARYDAAALGRWVFLQCLGAAVMLPGIVFPLNGGHPAWWLAAAAGFGLLVLADIPSKNHFR